MLSFFKKILGIESVDLAQLIKSGAVIVDVRSKGEFASGHVKGSVNIPLEQITNNVSNLKKHDHVIVCCRSGNRSGMAKRMLQSKGLNNVTNGGSWQNVNQFI
jgi:rhodanese-related sulfurtransferase